MSTKLLLTPEFLTVYVTVNTSDETFEFTIKVYDLDHLLTIVKEDYPEATSIIFTITTGA